MARQRLCEKKTARMREQTGLPVVAVLVRGGTEHRKDLCLEDGSVVHLYRDGSMQISTVRHNMVHNAEHNRTQCRVAVTGYIYFLPRGDMKLLIKRIILLMFLPFLPITLLIHIVFGDAVTGVKTSIIQKYKEHIKLFKEYWQ